MSEQPPRYDAPGASQPDGPVATSPWAAVFSVLWAPRAVFNLVRQRAPIAPPYVVQMVIGLIYGIVMVIFTSNFKEEMMQQLMQRPGMTEEAARTGQVFASGGIILGGVAGPWLSGLIFTLFLMLFGLFIRSDDRPTFRQYFSAVGYIRMPGNIGLLVLLPLMANAASLVALQKVAGALSAGAFVHDASPFVTGLLAQVAPFAIWEFVLVVVALAALYRTSESRTTWIGALMWVLAALTAGVAAVIGTMLAQLGGRFQPPQ